MDDVLDFEGTEDTLGKPALADLRMGLLTAPTLLAAEDHPKLALIISRDFSHPGDVDLAISLVQASKGVRRAKDLAVVQAEFAIDALNNLPNSEARDALFALAIKVLNRSH